MGVKAIQFTGGGEPTVHRDFDKLFNYALSLGLHVALVTNGVKINPDAIGGAAWVRVSLDAGTEETYRSLRRAPRGVFEKVLLHVRQLATLKRVALGIGFVVTRENHHEVGQAIDLAEDIGADNIRISAAFLPERAVKAAERTSRSSTGSAIASTTSRPDTRRSRCADTSTSRHTSAPT
jgi:MoaA/NifB/PqqE/SkfB family radical SAM enzyme